MNETPIGAAKLNTRRGVTFWAIRILAATVIALLVVANWTLYRDRRFNQFAIRELSYLRTRYLEAEKVRQEEQEALKDAGSRIDAIETRFDELFRSLRATDMQTELIELVNREQPSQALIVPAARQRHLDLSRYIYIPEPGHHLRIDLIVTDQRDLSAMAGPASDVPPTPKWKRVIHLPLEPKVLHRFECDVNYIDRVETLEIKLDGVDYFSLGLGHQTVRMSRMGRQWSNACWCTAGALPVDNPIEWLRCVQLGYWRRIGNGGFVARASDGVTQTEYRINVQIESSQPHLVPPAATRFNQQLFYTWYESTKRLEATEQQ